MHPRAVDFESSFVNQCIVTDQVVGGVPGKLHHDEVEDGQSDSVDGPTRVCKDAMLRTVMFGGLGSSQRAENGSPGSKDPSCDQLPKGIAGGLGHRGNEDLQKWHERCCNIH